MSSNKHGLGRSFESLIPSQIVSDALDPTFLTDEKLSNLKEVKTEQISPDNDQPRESFDEKALQGLADSIKTHGILQPLVVTEVTPNTYKIIAGERRWRAAKIVGLKNIPVLVRSMSAQHTIEVALIENVQRKNLKSLELATAYLKLHDQFNMTYQQIGERVGKTFSSVNNVVRLLTLCDEAKQALQDGRLSEGHARTLLWMADKTGQAKIMNRMVTEKWSVRKAEAYMANLRKAENHRNQPKRDKKVIVKETASTKKLSTRLKTNVYLQSKTRGGRLVIEYKNQAELDRLIEDLN